MDSLAGAPVLARNAPPAAAAFAAAMDAAAWAWEQAPAQAFLENTPYRDT